MKSHSLAISICNCCFNSNQEMQFEKCNWNGDNKLAPMIGGVGEQRNCVKRDQPQFTREIRTGKRE
jgi:hypothetical protein